jgi:hypothetical protein
MMDNVNKTWKNLTKELSYSKNNYSNNQKDVLFRNIINSCKNYHVPNTSPNLDSQNRFHRFVTAHFLKTHEERDRIALRHALIDIGKHLPLSNLSLLASFSSSILDFHDNMIKKLNSNYHIESLRYLSIDVIQHITSIKQSVDENKQFDFLITAVPLPSVPNKTNIILYDLEHGIRKPVILKGKQLPSKGLWISYSPVEEELVEPLMLSVAERNKLLGHGTSDDVRYEILHALSMSQLYSSSAIEVQPLIVRLLHEAKTIYHPKNMEQINSILKAQCLNDMKDLERITHRKMNLILKSYNDILNEILIGIKIEP